MLIHSKFTRRDFRIKEKKKKTEKYINFERLAGSFEIIRPYTPPPYSAYKWTRWNSFQRAPNGRHKPQANSRHFYFARRLSLHVSFSTRQHNFKLRPVLTSPWSAIRTTPSHLYVYTSQAIRSENKRLLLNGRETMAFALPAAVVNDKSTRFNVISHRFPFPPVLRKSLRKPPRIRILAKTSVLPLYERRVTESSVPNTVQHDTRFAIVTISGEIFPRSFVIQRA